jgi:hypothetical protein
MRIHQSMGLATGLLTLAGNVCAAGVTWRVTNDGTDSASCGNPASPCRSISQAMENASAGDFVSVGAGIYGNISGDGSFTHPGDEHPQLLPHHRVSAQPSGCIVCITKPLKVLSLHGAASTIIVGTAASGYPATVQIASPGATFGNVGHGFTITGTNSIGVYVDQDVGAVLQQNINIGGNVDIGDGIGFAFNGLEFRDRPCPDPSCTATATVFFTNNEATGSGTGFYLQDNAYTGTAVFKNNVASGGGSGFLVETGTQSISGAAVGVGNVSLSNNVAAHNSGYGFSLAQTGPIVGNSAFANSAAGFLVVPGAVFQGNSAIGNGGPGLIVQASADVFDDYNNDPQDQFRVFNHNNFYGNDRNRPALVLVEPNGGGPGVSPGPSAHCGILNVGKAAAVPGAPGPVNGDAPSPVIVQKATDNFWGSAKGPSPTGPGDAAGGACDQNGGVTISKPFATVEFAITTAP